MWWIDSVTQTKWAILTHIRKMPDRILTQVRQSVCDFITYYIRKFQSQNVMLPVLVKRSPNGWQDLGSIQRSAQFKRMVKMAKPTQARSQLSRQLSLLVAQAPNIPLEMGLYPWRFDAPFSELNWNSYGARKNMFQVLRSCIIPHTEKRMNLRSGYSIPSSSLVAHEDQEVWFFLNGPGGDKPLLQANGDALAELFGRKINLLHNASEGLINDLLECVTGKTGLNSGRTATSLCKLLEVELRQRNKVVLIAHSQGASISFHAIDKLAERLRKAGRDLSLLGKLELYTFGAACTDRTLPDRKS